MSKLFLFHCNDGPHLLTSPHLPGWRVLDLGGCRWLLMGTMGHMPLLPLTPVAAVTQTSFPPAHSGGKWQGKEAILVPLWSMASVG